MKDDSITVPFYTQLQKEIDKVDRKADLYNFLFYLSRVVLIFIAIAITLISALPAASVGNNNTIIILLGVLTTLITSVDTLFQIDVKKNTYKIMLFDLRALRADFVFHHQKGKDSNPETDKFFETYKSIQAMGRDLLGSDTK